MPQFDQKSIEMALTSAAAANLTGPVFINCVPYHVYDPPAALEFTLDLCEKTGIDPDRVIFEIIEVEHIIADDILPIVRLFKNEGFRIALDDLGSGYSSLGVLSQVQPDFLKIARTLIAGINKDAYKALVLSSLLQSARVLGTPTIAEGIETQEECEWARANGATYLQGNLFASPREMAAS
jgi:EAL domain-containing protein (putative c-di-GMP-specific phosphodiesterase class I)